MKITRSNLCYLSPVIRLPIYPKCGIRSLKHAINTNLPRESVAPIKYSQEITDCGAGYFMEKSRMRIFPTMDDLDL